MPTAQKIKVSVIALIAAVEARKQEVEEAYAKELANYPAKLAEWQTQSVAALKAAIAKVETGKSPSGDRYNGNVVSLNSRPEKPILTVDKYTKTINTLKMSEDETIQITVSDYGEYIR